MKLAESTSLGLLFWSLLCFWRFKIQLLHLKYCISTSEFPICDNLTAVYTHGCMSHDLQAATWPAGSHTTCRQPHDLPVLLGHKRLTPVSHLHHLFLLPAVLSPWYMQGWLLPVSQGSAQMTPSQRGPPWPPSLKQPFLSHSLPHYPVYVFTYLYHLVYF